LVVPVILKHTKESGNQKFLFLPGSIEHQSRIHFCTAAGYRHQWTNQGKARFERQQRPV